MSCPGLSSDSRIKDLTPGWALVLRTPVPVPWTSFPLPVLNELISLLTVKALFTGCLFLPAGGLGTLLHLGSLEVR